MPTTAEVIRYAKFAQEFFACEINNDKFLNGGSIDERLPLLLYLVRKDVEYLYDLNPDDSTLAGTTNYLYGLCSKYANQSEYQVPQNPATAIPIPSVNIIYKSVKIEKAIPFSYPTINLGNPVTDGASTLEIRDSGIDEESFLLFINSQKIDEGLDDQLSFTHSFVNNIFTLNFNTALNSSQRLEMRYVKANSI